jgi:hypothetical protein
MPRRHRLLAGALAALILGAPPLLAQRTGPLEQQAPFVFLDCNTRFCDFDHFRREVAWVNWVRDRQDAQVHILVTQQQTGGGGWELTLAFIGLRGYAGKADTLRHIAGATDTEAEVRDGLTQRIRLGLIRYVAPTAAGDLLDIRYRLAPGAVVTTAQPQDDPWNFWVFEIGASGSFDGQAQESGFSINGEAAASRTTEAFKVDLELDGRYRRDEFELDEGSTFVNTSENYSADLLMVWSLGPHWSLGALAEASRSTFVNQDFAIRGGPAVEYNIFPYGESTRRRLSFLYAAGASAFDYQEITVDSKLSEVRPLHHLSVQASVTQPWGEVDGSVSATQFLDDAKVHRIDTFARLEIRLFRGLDLELDAEFARIKDQFFLPAAGLTPEEILVRRRQRETDYRFSFSVGLSYRFGSAFNNVVNPRM